MSLITEEALFNCALYFPIICGGPRVSPSTRQLPREHSHPCRSAFEQIRALKVNSIEIPSKHCPINPQTKWNLTENIVTIMIQLTQELFDFKRKKLVRLIDSPQFAQSLQRCLRGLITVVSQRPSSHTEHARRAVGIQTFFSLQTNALHCGTFTPATSESMT